MVRTRGAARKAANSPGEGENAQPDDVSNEIPMVSEKHTEKNEKGSQKDQFNEDASVAKAGEGVDGERESTEELTGMATRRDKLGGERNVAVKEEVSFPSILDETISTTGSVLPLPQPYAPKPMYTPLVPSTPKRTAPNARPKTPKFDPEVHGVDIETDLLKEDGDNSFLQLIKRSPNKQDVENKSLEAPPQLDLGDEVQVMEVQLSTQTEVQMISSEGPSQFEKTGVEPKTHGDAVSGVPAEQFKSLTIHTHTPDPADPPLAVKKTRATAAIAARAQKAEPLKLTTPLTPRQRVPSRKAPVSPPRTETKQPTSSMKTPAKKNMPTTPPRASTAKNSLPRNKMAKATERTPPLDRGMNPASTTPSHNLRTKSIPLAKCAGEKISPKTPSKAPSKPTAVLSRQKLLKEPVLTGAPPSVEKKLTPLSPHNNSAKTSLLTSLQKGVKQPRRNIVEKPNGKPMTNKPSHFPSNAQPRGKESVIYPKTPVKETLTIRTKRAASGPLPPTKRLRPIPPTPSESAQNLQGSNASSTTATAGRPRIASLNTKPLSPIKSSKPPTKPAMFKLRGQEVAKKQAEEKEARKKRMEEAEAAKALQKGKEAKLRKQVPVRNTSLSSKTLRESSVCAAALGRENAAASGASTGTGKAEVSRKQSKSKPINGSTDASQPVLLTQKRKPTAKLTSATSKPAMSRNAPGPASNTTNGNTLLTPKQGDTARVEHVENTKKQAAEKGRAAVLKWAAQQKNRQDQTNPQGQVT